VKGTNLEKPMFDIDHPADGTTVLLLAELESATTDEKRAERSEILAVHLALREVGRREDTV
jgi:hypothetical protein